MARHRITENGHMMWFDSDEEYHAHLQKQEDIRKQQEEAEEAELVEKIKKIAVFVVTLVVFGVICIFWGAIDNLGKPKEQTVKNVEKAMQSSSVVSQPKQNSINTQIANEVEPEIVVEYSHDLEDKIEEYEDLDAYNDIENYSFSENDEIELEESLEPDYSRQKIYQNVEVDEEPKFPGGEHELMEYIADNIVYPQTAIDEGIQGRVIVSFVVEPNGKVTNVEVLRGIGDGCDEEAVRVVKSLPNWEPGVRRGKNVRVAIAVPVKFALE